MKKATLQFVGIFKNCVIVAFNKLSHELFLISILCINEYLYLFCCVVDQRFQVQFQNLRTASVRGGTPLMMLLFFSLFFYSILFLFSIYSAEFQFQEGEEFPLCNGRG